MGGLERLLFHLARDLDRERFDPHVILLAGRGRFVERMSAIGNTPVYVFDLHSGRAALGKSLIELPQLVWLLRRLRPGLIHAFGFKGDLLSRLLHRSLGRPALASTVANPELAHLRAVSWLNRIKSTRVGAFWADCRARAREAERLGIPASKVRVIYPGVEAPPEPGQAGTRSRVRRDLGLGDAARLILLAGDLREIKGHDRAIEAAPEIVQRAGDVHFLFLGAERSGGKISELARRSPVADRLHLVGYRAEPEPYFEAADLLLQPSRSEGLPRAVLEATIRGLPVVATDVGGLPEAIEDGVSGRLVPSGDLETLTQAVIGLLEDPEKARDLGREGQRRAGEIFGHGRMVREFEELYLELAEEKN